RLAGGAASAKSLHLSGLGPAEAQHLLQDRGLSGSEASWTSLVELYAGNPLALRLASDTILELFRGDIARFLAQGGVVFGDVRDLLDEQFRRLTDLEQQIMFWLTIEQEAVSLDVLRDNLVQPTTRGHLMDAVCSLRRRSMIQIAEAGEFFL